MTPERIRTACAEVVGRLLIRLRGDKDGYSLEVKGMVLASGSLSHCQEVALEHSPNYPASLDACKELIEHARKDGHPVTIQNGSKWSVNFNHPWVSSDSLELAICEAFLRLYGKWEEDTNLVNEKHYAFRPIH